ncbi:MAG: hypothetical protein PHQ04_03415 [Opitutaceae bacterium]|nr:hypothetical protein [Opitutaceae bacterium]
MLRLKLIPEHRSEVAPRATLTAALQKPGVASCRFVENIAAQRSNPTTTPHSLVFVARILHLLTQDMRKIAQAVQSRPVSDLA